MIKELVLFVAVGCAISFGVSYAIDAQIAELTPNSDVPVADLGAATRVPTVAEPIPVDVTAIQAKRNAAAAKLQKLIDRRDACQKLRMQQLANETPFGQLVVCWTDKASKEIEEAQTALDNAEAELKAK